MSALGQKQTSDRRSLMSALPPKADIAEGYQHVHFVPKADIRFYSITSSAMASSCGGMLRPSNFAVVALIVRSNFSRRRNRKMGQSG
jgi:hypothetical protein